jgi:hypothetical protein
MNNRYLRKIPLKEQRGPQERLHLKSLHSSVDAEGSYQDFTFFQSFLSPIQKWVDKKLNDYHLHFTEVCFLTSWNGRVLHNMHGQLFQVRSLIELIPDLQIFWFILFGV